MAGHSSRPTGGRRGDAVTEDLPPGSSSPSEGPAGMGVARAMGGPLGVVDLDEGWSMLRDCAIHRLEHFLRTGEALGRRKDGKLCIFTRKEYSDLYTTVYNMCTQRYPNNWSAQLYQRYGEALASYVEKEVVPRLSGLTEDDLIREVLLRWKNHKIYVHWMERFFVYLDRYYVKLQSQEPLHHKGVLIFKQLVFERVQGPLREAILGAIQSHREGRPVDEGVLREIIDVYIGLDSNGLFLYQRELEDYLLPDTADYYSRVSDQWIESLRFTDYLQRTQDALLAEQRRCSTYLHRSSALKLQKMVLEATLAQRQDQLLQKETAIEFLLTNNRRQELRQAHRLFSFVQGGVEAIALTFKKFVSEKGNKIVDQRLNQLEAGLSSSSSSSSSSLSSSSSSKVGGSSTFPSVAEAQQADAAFVQSLLDLHEKYKGIVEECFSVTSQSFSSSSSASSSASTSCCSLLYLPTQQQKLFKPCEPSTGGRGQGGSPDPLFQKSLKEAFENFINRDMGRQSFAHLLSFFCDRLLRKAGERRSEEQVEAMLVRVVEVFNYLTDKDVFAECYRAQLARRLLHETSASEDLEKSVIGKLKLKCGSHFTSKLEGMLHDLNGASDTYRKFVQWILEKKKLDHASSGRREVASAPTTTSDSKEGRERGDVRDRGMESPVSGESEQKKDLFEAVSVIATGQHHHHQRGGGVGSGVAVVEGIEFSVQILTTGHWPTYPTTSVCLPPALKHCQLLFEEFYASQTQHRRVTWVPALGTVVVSGLFQKKHDLLCNVYQACVLLLFNWDSPYFPDGRHRRPYQEKNEGAGAQDQPGGAEQKREDPKLTLSQMVEILGLDEPTVKKMLGSFFLGRFKIIKKLGDDTYQVDPTFTCLNRKIKIPTPLQEEVQSRERVEEDRSIAIEAAIVRIMKARKSLQHPQLLAEVLSQLSFFKPNPKLIKKRLEHLIEREFIERDRDNPNLYRYMA